MLGFWDYEEGWIHGCSQKLYIQIFEILWKTSGL